MHHESRWTCRLEFSFRKTFWVCRLLCRCLKNENALHQIVMWFHNNNKGIFVFLSLSVKPDLMAVKPAATGKHTCHLNYTKTKVKIFVITQSHNNLDCRLNCPLLLKNDSIFTLTWILGQMTQMQVLLCLFKENVEDTSVMYFGSRSGGGCWLFLWWVADVIALLCNFCFWCFIHILSHVYS